MVRGSETVFKPRTVAEQPRNNGREYRREYRKRNPEKIKAQKRRRHLRQREIKFQTINPEIKMDIDRKFRKDIIALMQKHFGETGKVCNSFSITPDKEYLKKGWFGINGFRVSYSHPKKEIVKTEPQ